MKIIVLSGLYPPHNRGGAEKIASLLVKELTDMGHQVTVVTTGKKSGLENNDNVRVYILSPRNIFWYGEIGRYLLVVRAVWHLIDLFNFWQAARVREILKIEKPDLVWSHNLKGLGFLIPRIVKKLGIRHAHTLHDIQLLAPSGVATARQLHLGLYGRLTRWLFGSPTIVTSPSRWLLETYRRFGFFGQSICEVLPHIFQSQSPVTLMAGKKQLMLFLGQLEATKGLPFLIEAMHDESLELLVVGSGSLEDYVKKSGVDYRGRLNGEALENLWSEVSFLVAPSLILENSPTVILEAFGHGVPVIASAIGGVPELVEEGKTGFLFEPGNRESLRQAINRAHAADYQILRRHALERYEQLRQEHITTLARIISSKL